MQSVSSHFFPGVVFSTVLLAIAADAQGQVKVLSSQGTPLEVLEFFEDGSLLGGDANGRVFLWKTFEPEATPRVLLDEVAPPSLLYTMPDGLGVAVAGGDGVIRIVDPANDSEIKELEKADFVTIQSFGYSKLTRQLTGLADNSKLIVWDLESGQIVSTVTLAGFQPPLALSANGLYLVGSDATGGLVAWDRRAEAILQSYQGFYGQVTAVAISPFNNYVAAANDLKPERIYLWEMPTGESFPSLRVDQGTKRSIRFSQDETRLTVIAVDGWLTVVDLFSGEDLVSKHAIQELGAPLAISSYDSELAIANPDGSIELAFLAFADGGAAMKEAHHLDHAGTQDLLVSLHGDPLEGLEPSPIDLKRNAKHYGSDPDLHADGDRTRVARLQQEVDSDFGGPAQSGGAEEGDYVTVPVYYGTNRALGAEVSWGNRFLDFFSTTAAIVLYVLTGVALLVGLWFGRSQGVVALVLGVLLVVVSAVGFASAEAAWMGNRPGDEYGTETAPLNYGLCNVTVPNAPHHLLGRLESAPEFWVFRWSEDPNSHIILADVSPQGEEAYFDAVKEHIGRSTRKETFVFIHGYNVTFRDAARRTAQLAVDLGFEGAPMFFSWPSRADPLAYPSDEATAAASWIPLREFLEALATRTDADKFHIIAHSMGGRILGRALQEIDANVRTKFHQIVLAAPDIDQRVFLNEIAPAIVPEYRRITLYASSNDRALILSKKFHDYQRVGDTRPTVTVHQGIDTIDASFVNTSFLGHSSYGDSAWIINDLFWLLKHDKSAEERFGLRAANTEGSLYWRVVPR